MFAIYSMYITDRLWYFLLIKAKNIYGKSGLCVILGVSGVILVIFGIVLIYYVVTGVIELPLK